MSGWIIDDGPFGNLAQSFAAPVLASWKRTRLIVAKATADAVDQDGSGNRRALLGPDDGDQPFEIIDIQLHLRDEGEISDGQFDDLCERTRRVDQALPGIPWRIQNPPPTP